MIWYGSMMSHVFAVYTVGVVDLKPFLPGAVIHHLVNIGGAEVLAGVAVFFLASRGA